MNKKQSSPDRYKKQGGKKEERGGQKGFKKFFKEDAGKHAGNKEDRPDRKNADTTERKYRKSSEKNESSSSRGAFRRDERPSAKRGPRDNDRPRDFEEKRGSSFRPDKERDGSSSRGAFRRDERPSVKRGPRDNDRPRDFEEKRGSSFRPDKERDGSSSRGSFRRDEKPSGKRGPRDNDRPRDFGEKRGSSFRPDKEHGGSSSRGSFRRDEKPSEKRGPRDNDRPRDFDGKKGYSSRPDKERGGSSSRGTFRRDEKPSGKRGPRSSDGPGDFDGKKGYSSRPDKKNDKYKEPAPRPDKYAHAFGKLDDEELAAHQQKIKAKKAEREEGEEVSFSKSLDKWETEADTERKEHSEKPFARKREAGSADREPRHTKKDKFKRNFDNENDHEKAYSAKADDKTGRKRIVKKNDDDDDDEDDGSEMLIAGKMPLNKYIAHCDICSRRDAVALIKDGKVRVNGAIITEPGYKVAEGEEITLNDKRLTVQKNLVYILLNKPKGYITTTDDPKGRKTVMDIVQGYVDERVFPIGRLDRNTTGLLLLTNDGELTQKLSHPKYEVRKIYQVKLDKALAKNDFDKITTGLTLEDGPVKVDAIEYLDAKEEIGLEIHSGKNRIVRRIFESLGYEVEKLDRVMYAGLTKKNVLRGKWRFLTKQEVINLKHFK